MSVIEKQYPVDVYVFASRKYWRDGDELAGRYQQLRDTFRQIEPDAEENNLRFHLVSSDEDIERIDHQETGEFAAFIPISGSVQNWMLHLSSRFKSIALFNAYLSDTGIPKELTDRILCANAHPAAVDFYSHLNLKRRSIFWLNSLDKWSSILKAYQAIQRLKNARLLQIGETEPWVINSCRDPGRFRESLGVEIIPVAAKELYAEISRAKGKTVAEYASRWEDDSRELCGVNTADLMEACKVTVGIEQLLTKYNADGVSLACFTMIDDIGTTGCLALSYHNDSRGIAAACEGDLDAAVTLLLLKALDVDYAWMGNPVIHEADYIDLVHCTAPCRIGQRQLEYRLMRHHESGRGVSPEVLLPLNEPVTITRIGNNVRDILTCPGETTHCPKLATCRTQMRIKIPSSEKLVESLMGTHLVCSFRDATPELTYYADLTGLSKRIV